MKQILFISALTLICCQEGLAQTITKTKNSVNNTTGEPRIFGERVSYVSLKRDTLILPDDNLGRLIHATWKDVPKSKQPVIIFADAVTIKKKNENFLVAFRKKPIPTND
jgi:hypothetical protein